MALGATYLLGRRLFDLTTAAVAIAVLAVHGFTTRYATEVRGYSLMVLLTLLAALLLHRAVTEQRRRWWIWYGVLAVLAYFAHELALLTIGAQLLSLLALGRKVPVEARARRERGGRVHVLGVARHHLVGQSC